MLIVLGVILSAILIFVCICAGLIGAYAFWITFYPEGGSRVARLSANIATGIMLLLFLIFTLAPLPIFNQ